MASLSSEGQEAEDLETSTFNTLCDLLVRSSSTTGVQGADKINREVQQSQILTEGGTERERQTERERKTVMKRERGK